MRVLGASLNLYLWHLKYLLRIYLCYILTYRHTYKFTCVNSPSTTHTKRSIKVLQCYKFKELTKDYTDWIKADQLVGMPLFNISTVFVFNKSYFCSLGGYLPLIRVYMPCSDESGWYISNFMFYVLQVKHLLKILVLLFILLLLIVWQVFVLLWINSRSCKAADG